MRRNVSEDSARYGRASTSLTTKKGASAYSSAQGMRGRTNCGRASACHASARTTLPSGECVLCVEQCFNATEQGFHAIAFLHDCRYAEKLGEPFAKRRLSNSVKITIGVFGMLMLSCAATSIPFAIGRLRSKTTRSGLRVCAFLIA